MIELNTKILCPICGYDNYVALDITQYVKLKDKTEPFTIGECPSCQRKLLIPITIPYYVAHQQIAGNETIMQVIKELVDQASDDELKDEQSLKDNMLQVISDVKIMDPDYVEHYQDELIEYMNFIIAQNTTPIQPSLPLNDMTKLNIERTYRSAYR